MLAVLAGGCALALFLQPATYRIERTRRIAVRADRARAVLEDVRELAACCTPGTAGAPTFSEPTRGPGAWVEWRAEGRRARATLEQVSAARVSIRYDLPGASSRQIVDLRAAGTQTDVTWAIEGDKSGLLQRVLWPVANLDARVGPDIERAIAGLEQRSRAR